MSDEIIHIKNPVGRPKGSTNKAAKFRHYKPKKWEAWMTALVISSTAGKANKELAEIYEISETHVSNLLSTEQAHNIKLELKKALLKESPEIADRMVKVSEKAFTRMEEFLENETLAKNSPMNYTDRAMKIFQMTYPSAHQAEEKQESNVTNIQNNVFITQPEILERINEGLKTSNEIAVIHNETRQKLLLDPINKVNE